MWSSEMKSQRGTAFKSHEFSGRLVICLSLSFPRVSAPLKTSGEVLMLYFTENVLGANQPSTTAARVPLHSATGLASLFI